MLQTEYVRNLHCNYERIFLDRKPEDTKYQYCILNRGGIKGLLPCSLRYINGLAYLYYDISSKQNIVQLFEKRAITREWLQDFLWSYRQIQQELDRFLLDEHNVIWYPEQVFLDLDNHTFSFMYIPYYKQENGFGKLVEFWVEHIDYGDEALVEFVYRVYDRLEKNGDAYLQGQIFEDAKRLEQRVTEKQESSEILNLVNPEQETLQSEAGYEQSPGVKEEKKKLFGIFEGKRRKNKEARDNYRLEMEQAMSGYAVAEECTYECRESESQETDYGRTVYIEEKADPSKMMRRLYSPEGKLLASLDKDAFSIGKKKEEVDLVLDDMSVSRMHARIIKQGEEVYLEDLNSTNGTFKNGLRLEPYERRKLETEDEIKCGNVTVIFR
jgi:FOG: FHA domain